MTETANNLLLIWEARGLPPEDQKDAIEATIRASIADELYDLEAPEDLICHEVSLSDARYGPIVLVYGKAGSEAFYCCYVNHYYDRL